MTNAAHPGLLVEIAPGELIDKITVLEIKAERISDPARLAHIQTELEILTKTRDEKLPATEELSRITDALKQINIIIWDQSDRIRVLGGAGDFGEEFAKVSWDIHHANDTRAALKKEINLLLNSRLVEEKSYPHWK